MHYYDDGNVILCLGDEHFRVHESILRLNYKLDKMLGKRSGEDTTQDSSKSPCGHPEQDHKGIIAYLKLLEKEPSDIEQLLSILYAQNNVELTWSNFELVYKLADEYDIHGLNDTCIQFLNQNTMDYPLETLRMAEKYELADIFEASSAIILDEYEEYKSKDEYTKLSRKTRALLLETLLGHLQGIQRICQRPLDALSDSCEHIQFSKTFSYIERRRSWIKFDTKETFEHWVNCPCPDPECHSNLANEVQATLDLRENGASIGNNIYYLYITLRDLSDYKYPGDSDEDDPDH